MKNQIISIAHSKGGVGKSTLAFHLLGALQKEKAILFDLDAQNTCFSFNMYREQPLNVIKISSKSELEKAIKEHQDKIIIIDVGGFDSDLNRIAIALSHSVLTPLKDTIPETASLEKFKEILSTIKKVSNVKAYGLINNTHPLSTNFERINTIVNDSENITMLNTIIRHRANYNSTLEEGLTVVEKSKPAKPSKASLEIQALIKEIF